MSLKSRINHLSRGRLRIFVFGGLLDADDYTDPKIGVLPYTPQRDGESTEAWHARLHALGHQLFPRARMVVYPQIWDTD